MSHHGPMYVTQDITGWKANQLTTWLLEHPEWGEADIRCCACEICGEVTELVMPA